MTNSIHRFAVSLLLVLAAGLPGQEAPPPEVVKPKRPPNDPAARAFLREAEERSASWNGFPGFSSKISVYHEGKTHNGEMAVTPDRKVRVYLGDAEARKWVTDVITQIAATSSRKDFDERYQNVGVVFGRDDRHPLGQLVELRGDPYESRFRVLDGEVRMIERTTATQKILLHIISIERDAEDRKRARSFVVSYLDKKTGGMVRSEAILDRRVVVEKYVLPETWSETRVSRGASSTYSLLVTEHTLLPETLAESTAQSR
jgi:hypothetical protein